MPVRCEIIHTLVRPAHIEIDDLYEYACLFPLDVHEGVYIWTVAVFLDILVVEHSDYRIVRRCIPLCRIQCIRTDLHFHDVLHHVKLEIIPEVQRECRQWQYVPVRRVLEQCLMFKVELPYLEILSERCR